MKRNVLSKIFGKRETPTQPAAQTKARASLDLSDQLGRSDYLGKAADAKHAARAAVKAGGHLDLPRLEW